MSDTYHYQCTLSDALIEFAEKEVNEKASWRDRDIHALRLLVQKNEDIKCPLDSSFLVRFLRAKRFDYDNAYQLLVNYFVCKATNHQQLKGLTPSKCADLVDAGMVMLLPNRDVMERKVIYMRFEVVFEQGRWDAAEVKMARLLQVIMLTVEHTIRDEETQIRGVVVVVNVSGVGLVHLRNTEVSFVSTIAHLMQQAFPLRVKAIHIVNEPSIFCHLFTLVRPFLTHKMLARHHFHGSSYDSLHKAVGAHALPLELGGQLPEGDVLALAWKEELTRQEGYFHELNKYHVHPACVPATFHDVHQEAPSYCLGGLYKRLNL